jgi:phosphonate transport system substrate-binding protein
MHALTFVSLMAPNADPLYQSLAAYLARCLARPVRFLGEVDWQERQRLLIHGDADFGVMCGAPYVRYQAVPAPPLALLAAPVMRHPRYGNQPVYFSDVISRADAPVRSFADLRGKTWVYNEPNSYSGYYVVCAHLADLGEDARYFGKTIASGSHEQSLGMVRTGAADASAIDSVVLERALEVSPELAAELRIIHTLGPSPIPPLVVHADRPRSLRHALREALLRMHQTHEGQHVLANSPISHFVSVDDAAYDPIRRRLDRASAVRLVLP